MEFQDGQWVQIIDHFNLTGAIGFLIGYNIEEHEYRVQITQDKKGERRCYKLWLLKDQLVPLTDLNHEEDIKALIDLALENNDREWFEELTNSIKPQAMPW